MLSTYIFPIGLNGSLLNEPAVIISLINCPGSIVYGPEKSVRSASIYFHPIQSIPINSSTKSNAFQLVLPSTPIPVLNHNPWASSVA